MVLNPMGGPWSGRLSPAAAVRAGMIAFVLAVVGIVASLQAGAIVPFIAASLVVGVAQGAASTGGIRALLADVGQQERAGLLSTIYLISYSGAAIPGMIAGKLTNRFELFQIALGYAALGIGAAVLAMVSARNPVQARMGSDDEVPGIHETPP
jgi:MFS family permease